MLKNYINSNSAKDEAFNYVDADMTDEDIHADIENCLAGYEFEAEEDRETYISLILEAAAELRSKS